MKIDELQKPTVHLNGTGLASLGRQYREASEGLRKALDAMGPMSPNGRDYYPQGPGAFHLAVEQHVARIAKVREALAEVDALWDYLANGPS